MARHHTHDRDGGDYFPGEVATGLGGGGGGGYYGAGGGGAGYGTSGAGGGGGSSFAAVTAAFQTGVGADNDGDGKIIVSWTPGDTSCAALPVTTNPTFTG